MFVLPAIALLVALGPAGQADNLAFYKQIASVDILQAKAVQAELKVTDSQRSDFNKHADAYNTSTKSLTADAQAGKVTRAEFTQKLADAQALLHDNVIAVLTPTQQTRLGQITLQQGGVLAVLNPVVASKLTLTEAQRKTLTDGLQATGKEVAEIERKAKEPVIDKYKAMKPASEAEKDRLAGELQKELKAINEKIKPDLLKARKGFEDLVDKTLTSGQKKTWGDLKGPAFKAS